MESSTLTVIHSKISLEYSRRELKLLCAQICKKLIKPFKRLFRFFSPNIHSLQDEDLVKGPVCGEQSGAVWSCNAGSVSGQSLK